MIASRGMNPRAFASARARPPLTATLLATLGVSLSLMACGTKASAGRADEAGGASASDRPEAAAGAGGAAGENVAGEPGLSQPPGSADNHLDVTVVTDEASSVSADYDFLQGTTLETTDANGIVYKLEIPAQALAPATTITLAPVASLDGYPFQAGLTAAVQLLPEGTTFNQLVTITITLPDTIDAAAATAFGFGEDGADFHLRDMSLAKESATFVTYHFSGYGLGEASPAETKRYALRTPKGWEAYLEQETAATLGTAKALR